MLSAKFKRRVELEPCVYRGGGLSAGAAGTVAAGNEFSAFQSLGVRHVGGIQQECGWRGLSDGKGPEPRESCLCLRAGAC